MIKRCDLSVKLAFQTLPTPLSPRLKTGIEEPLKKIKSRPTAYGKALKEKLSLLPSPPLREAVTCHEGPVP